jgi:hypothetical protein
MANITYLLGAGASVNCLPIVGQIADRIGSLQALLASKYLELSQSSYVTTTDPIKEVLSRPIQNHDPYHHILKLVSDLEWLKSEGTKHATVDTLAKKFYLTKERDKLHKLKLILSTFFTLIQCTSRPDGRYDSLLAGLLNEQLNLPNNVNFLTWNYDLQIELAGMEYFQTKDVNAMQTSLKTYPRAGLSASPYAPKVVHLNGVAGLYESGDSFANLYRKINSTGSLANDLIASLEEIKFIYEPSAKYSLNFHNLFSFSWEDNDVAREAREYAMNIMRNTHVLVLIGYSFPFFNRSVDRSLLTSASQLLKIYYQDPKINGNFLTQQFKLQIPIEHVPEVDQFFIPHEL